MSARLLPIVAAGTLLLGCKGGGGAATEPMDFSAAALDRDVFLPNCAFSSCHANPALAAQLDLTGGLCASMVHRSSCLFPGKSLVVPGHPEQSFLVDKLTGDNLAAQPETACATANARMPYGGVVLPPSAIARVRAWIAAGAPCDGAGEPGDGGTTLSPDGGGGGASGAGGTTPDGGGEGGGGGGGSPAYVLTLATNVARVRAGMRATVTLTVDPPVGAAGASVTLEAGDHEALAVPAAVFVPARAGRVTFDVVGRKPAVAVVVSASLPPAVPAPGATTGAASQPARAELALSIDGLYLAEVFYGAGAGGGPSGDSSQWVKIVNVTGVPIPLDGYRLGAGRASYADTTAALAGVLAAGGCAVVGGPDSSARNGAPVFDQAFDFSPDIPHPVPGQAAVGLGLFESGASVPLDAVLAGGDNTGALRGPDGSVAAPVVSGVDAAHSLLRQPGAQPGGQPGSWLEGAAPTPGQCPQGW